jgi:hypothetical protein
MQRLTRNKEKKHGKVQRAWRDGSPKGPSKEYRRCPQCKKLRKRWFRANEWYPSRIRWQKLEENGPTVCHICVCRAKGIEFVGG